MTSNAVVKCRPLLGETPISLFDLNFCPPLSIQLRSLYIGFSRKYQAATEHRLQWNLLVRNGLTPRGMVMKKLSIFVVWMISLAIWAQPILAEQKPTLRWVGCGISKKAYLVALAKAYEKKTGVVIDVQGGGATRGIREVASMSADMGGSCRRRMFSAEEERGIIQVPVAWDALVVIVHKKNPVKNITMDKLRQVRKLIDDSGLDIRLEIDGGVKADNIGEIKAAGADTFVSGSGIFGKGKDDDPHRYNSIIQQMRDAMAKVG